eukprot:g22813.t1
MPEGQTPEHLLARSFSENHPKCARCRAAARPAVLMFGEWGDKEWLDSQGQVSRWSNFMQGLGEVVAATTNLRCVLLEIGAGTRVPTVRQTSEQILEVLLSGGANAKLLRVNPKDAEPDDADLAEHILSFQSTGLEFLRAVDALLPEELQQSVFLGASAAEVKGPEQLGLSDSQSSEATSQEPEAELDSEARLAGRVYSTSEDTMRWRWERLIEEVAVTWALRPPGRRAWFGDHRSAATTGCADALNSENVELQARIKGLEAERSRRSPPSSCVICMENLANVVCLPHTYAAERSSCPICRATINERMLIFMP